MEVGSAYSTVSLSTGPSGEEELDPLETIGEEDQGFERSEDRVALEPALERLPEREREILRMRFEEGLPQTQIAQARRPLADARLAPDPQVARRDARGAHLRAGLRRAARNRASLAAARPRPGRVPRRDDERRGERAPGRARASMALGRRAGRARPGAASARATPSRCWPVYTPPLTYRRSEGADGTDVVPGVAERVPAASGDGRTYSLRMRHGLHFTNGRPVRAGRRGAIRSSRARALGPVGRRLFAGISNTSQRRSEAAPSGIGAAAPGPVVPACAGRGTGRAWSRRAPRCGRCAPGRRRGSAPIASSRRGPGARSCSRATGTSACRASQTAGSTRSWSTSGGTPVAADRGGDRATRST